MSTVGAGRVTTSFREFCTVGIRQHCGEESAWLMADQPSESERIGGIIAGLMKAWNTHDMHAFAELFAEDASFVNVNGSWLERPDQIEDFHRIIHNSDFKDSIAEIRPAKISVVRSDVAVVQATWQIRGDSRRSEPRDYVMTLVLRKQDEQWKILAAQNGSAEDRASLGFTHLRSGDVAPLCERPGAIRLMTRTAFTPRSQLLTLPGTTATGERWLVYSQAKPTSSTLPRDGFTTHR
jgi:uncharacterized protein (TIGR02246 family)